MCERFESRCNFDGIRFRRRREHGKRRREERRRASGAEASACTTCCLPPWFLSCTQRWTRRAPLALATKGAPRAMAADRPLRPDPEESERQRRPCGRRGFYLRLYHVVSTSVVRHTCSTLETEAWCRARSSVPFRRHRDFFLELPELGFRSSACARVSQGPPGIIPPLPYLERAPKAR